MSLWGNNDGKTASGTIAIAANGAVTGTSTAFTTEARVGDYIRAGGEDYFITAIASNTASGVAALASVIFNRPPETIFTVIPIGPRSFAKERVRPSRPALAII